MTSWTPQESLMYVRFRTQAKFTLFHIITYIWILYEGLISVICIYIDFFSVCLGLLKCHGNISHIFFYQGFLSRITGLQEKGEGIFSTPQHHFYPFHRHLDISRAITGENSPLSIASSRTQTGNLYFASASH